ncbi:MAG: CHC2 zinc finger domain-containing protein [bacterium]
MKHQNLAQEIKSRINIINLIEDFGVKLDKSGSFYKGLCPFHNDTQASLSVNPNKQLFKCFGCNAAGDIFNFYMKKENVDFNTALARLAEKIGLKLTGKKKTDYGCKLSDYANLKQLPIEFLMSLGLKQTHHFGKPIMVIPYLNEDGKPFSIQYREALYKSDGKDNRFRFQKGQHVFLYGVWRLKEFKKDYVVLVEGASDCHTCWYKGIQAVGIPGASSWQEEWAKYFEGFQKIYFWEEPDSGGKTAYEKLNKSSLKDRLLRIKHDSCKDASELYLSDKDNFVENFNIVLDLAEPWPDQNNSKVDEKPEKEEQGKTKPDSKSKILINLVLSDPKIVLFHDEKQSGYAQLDNQIILLRSRLFKNYIRKKLWELLNDTCSEESLKSAIGVLEAKAIFDNELHELFVRTAQKDDKYFYDLGGGRVACFEKGRDWTILDHTPILFRSFSHQKDQVMPKEPGDIKKVLRYLNFTDEKQKLLYLCYLVTCLVPDIPHPIIVITGEQGSGKTTFFKITKPIIDPSHVKTVSTFSDGREFVQAAFHHYLMFLDNLTHLSKWQEDALCRFSTGEGFTKRELFSDDDDIFYSFRRCAGINGINLVTDRPDVLDRSIIFSMDHINESKRKSERKIIQEFEKDLPYILQGVFDTFSKAIESVDNIVLNCKPRMADFSIWGSAIAKVLGYEQGEFLDAYKENINMQNQEAIDASPIGKAIINYMDGKSETEWETPDFLLSLLKDEAERLKIDISQKYWPKDARWLWRRIKEVSTNLRAMGIVAKRDDAKKGTEGRLIKLERIISKNSGNDVSVVSNALKQKNQNVIKDNTSFDVVSDISDIELRDDTTENKDDTNFDIVSDNLL